MLELPAQAVAASTARAHVRRTLDAWQLSALCDVVVLLVSELVTNSVVHAGSTSVLRLEQTEGGVRVTVSDGSPVLPARRRRSGTATTGRGCQLLADLADTWGAEAQDDGKQVWFVVTGGHDPWAAVHTDALLAEADP